MAAVRDTYMSDYGISVEETQRLVEFYRNADEEEREMIKRISESVYPCIANQLFCNLTTGIGYDNLCKLKPIRMQRKDFQGYRRKVLKELYDFINEKGEFYEK